MGYSFRLEARVLLHAPSHRQDSKYHSLCYTSRRALDGRNRGEMEDCCLLVSVDLAVGISGTGRRMFFIFWCKSQSCVGSWISSRFCNSEYLLRFCYSRIVRYNKKIKIIHKFCLNNSKMLMFWIISRRTKTDVQTIRAKEKEGSWYHLTRTGSSGSMIVLTIWLLRCFSHLARR